MRTGAWIENGVIAPIVLMIRRRSAEVHKLRLYRFSVPLLLAPLVGQAVAQLRAGRDLEFTGFGLWVWLTVALLPIAWDYSLLPLLPWLVAGVWQGRPRVAVLAGVALALPMVPWEGDASLPILLALGAAGLVLARQAGPLPRRR